MAVFNTYIVGVTLGTVLPIWAVVVAIYRYYFHPLRNFPGPITNAVSGLPTVVNLISGGQHAYIKRLHDRYGAVVRIAPNELSFLSPGAWEDIYGFRSHDEPLEKDPIWIGALVNDGAHPMPYAPRQDHGRLRRAFSHPFSNTSVLQQESIIQSHLRKLVWRLGELADASQSRPINLKDWYLFVTLDVIGDLCFGAPFGCLDKGTGTEWSRSLMKAIRCAVYDQASRRIAGPGTWLQKKMASYLIPQEYQDGKMKHFLNSREKVEERLKYGLESEKRDFIYYVLRSNEAKKLLTPLEIIVNSSAFVAAGSDNTTTALTVITYCVLANPEAQAKVVAEIRGRVETADDITWANIKDLPYLGAVISEGLRLYGPITVGLLRQVNPAGKGIVIDGNYVPPGTTVSVHLWSAGHSKLNWTRPEEFLPERWLNPDQFPHDRLQASQPFSLGPRGCIGKNLSLIELRLALCYIFWAFDVELDRESAWKWDIAGEMKNITTYLTIERPDLMATLRRVERG
ncbi:Cytochrome P450 monooxygenase abl2 [Echria macrotheca]|uniref:Cytochrome P450 monooxygenase abl2 n=1 Tax=Echria macrotheca TaxID=438768 RepID=A0AAJ0B6Z7_9PEZI|nr:Cytochrome P450 monooxygenase abl2 [Echria macrotheca]